MGLGDERIVRDQIGHTSNTIFNHPPQSQTLEHHHHTTTLPFQNPDPIPTASASNFKTPPPQPPPSTAAAGGSISAAPSSSVRYRECLKNHAAASGGHVLDGCGEFMPAGDGDESSPGSLRCAACDCHRNFHRKEIDGGGGESHHHQYHHHQYHHHVPNSSYYSYNPNNNNKDNNGRRSSIATPITITPPPQQINPPQPPLHHHQQQHPHPHPHPHQHQHQHQHQQRLRHYNQFPQAAHMMPMQPMMMAFGGGTAAESSSEDLNMFETTSNYGYGFGGQGSVQPSGSAASKKRFRTKFSQPQKEKMMELAEKLGWKIQKHDEQEVQQFCSEVGVKKKAFKVWMHNNKQNIMKKKEM